MVYTFSVFKIAQIINDYDKNCTFLKDDVHVFDTRCTDSYTKYMLIFHSDEHYVSKNRQI